MAHHGQDGDPLALLLAALVCALVGALVALPALRLSGLYLALATAAFAVFLDRWVFLLPSFDLGPWTIRLFRSEEHTSELQSLMRTSYAVFCLKKKNPDT